MINRADTADGVLLGLINIVKKGYHVLEFSSNDVTYGNISMIKTHLIPEKAKLSGDKYELWGWSVGLRFF